jgi:hypothetical protein
MVGVGVKRTLVHVARALVGLIVAIAITTTAVTVAVALVLIEIAIIVVTVIAFTAAVAFITRQFIIAFTIHVTVTIVISIAAADVLVSAVTVAGVVSGAVVAGRASEIRQNLHKIDEFLSGCSRCKLLGVPDECGLIVRTLTAKEGFLDVLFSRQRIRTRHHGRVLDKHVESKKERSRFHVGWNVSATHSNVRDEGGSFHVGTDCGRDVCLDRDLLDLNDGTGHWQTEDRLLVNLMIVGIENRLKVGYLVTEHHTQGI